MTTADAPLAGRTKIACAGSCFAQHIARYLNAAGGFQTAFETPPPGVGDHEDGYGQFACRYGNVYTVKQLRDLVEQALGLRPPIFDLVTDDDGRTWDLLRPRAVPDGFASEREARLDREYHLARVADMLREADVFVFTLGLTEAWVNRDGDYTYPVCPGTARGRFDPQEHAFHNDSYPEVEADLRRVVDLLTEVNPDLRIVLTVSPVPLVATYTGQPVVVATSYSKSVLRAACEAVVRDRAAVDYFPSYEMITSHVGGGRFFADNLRDVRPEGVRFVMETFFARFLGREAPATPAPAPSFVPASPQDSLPLPDQVECDELLNDPFGGAASLDGTPVPAGAAV